MAAQIGYDHGVKHLSYAAQVGYDTGVKHLNGVMFAAQAGVDGYHKTGSISVAAQAGVDGYHTGTKFHAHRRSLEDDEDLFERDLEAFDDLEAREPFESVSFFISIINTHWMQISGHIAVRDLKLLLKLLPKLVSMLLLKALGLVTSAVA
jgi:hypothetical protein